jgi:hypothetical protein
MEVQTVTLMLNLYDVKEVGKDFVVLTDNATNVKIIFADELQTTEGVTPLTKEEQAGLLKGILCKVGLEAPVVPVNQPKNIGIFLDHSDDFGGLRSHRFPYRIASLEVSAKGG